MGVRPTGQSRDREVTFRLTMIGAAQWLVKQKKGLYSMQDVLGLE